VNFQHQRENQLADSQHVHAHFLPAYNFIGLWKPCEHGFYNPFTDRDNLGFYGSLERYAAFNPAKQFGQIPIIGMSSPQTEPALRARDTRCMMLLAMLNDHDLGSWNAGGRDSQVIGALRRARNQFRPWEKDVTFAGYWENGALVAATPAAAVRVSLYRRPDQLLLIVGNPGDETADVRVKPVWSKLNLDPACLHPVDAESDAVLTWDRQTLELTIPRHDLRVIRLAP
jgi:hypothetical protein